MPLKPGDKAPGFSLYSSDRKLVGLDDYRGKHVLLLFFPLAFTGGCTDELCSVRDDLPAYRELDTEILAISVDSTAALARFREENGYPFSLLSDFNREVSRSYEAMYEEFGDGMRGVSKRAAFVIDQKGTVRYAEVLENADSQPNFVEIKRVLSALNA